MSNHLQDFILESTLTQLYIADWHDKQPPTTSTRWTPRTPLQRKLAILDHLAAVGCINHFYALRKGSLTVPTQGTAYKHTAFFHCTPAPPPLNPTLTRPFLSIIPALTEGNSPHCDIYSITHRWHNIPFYLYHLHLDIINLLSAGTWCCIHLLMYDSYFVSIGDPTVI